MLVAIELFRRSDPAAAGTVLADVWGEASFVINMAALAWAALRVRDLRESHDTLTNSLGPRHITGGDPHAGTIDLSQSGRSGRVELSAYLLETQLTSTDEARQSRSLALVKA